MVPPLGALLAFGLWLLAVALAVAVVVRHLRLPAGARGRLSAGDSLVLLTAGLPAPALLTIPFDDYARRWFPSGTPPWFVGCEFLFWVGAWFVLASAILVRHRPVVGRDRLWAGVLSCGVSAAAALLWFGISG